MLYFSVMASISPPITPITCVKIGSKLPARPPRRPRPPPGPVVWSWLGVEPRVRLAGRDLRLEPGPAQDRADGDDLVAHGVAVVEGSHDLVDAAGGLARHAYRDST